jgi:hypothetical protein
MKSEKGSQGIYADARVIKRLLTPSKMLLKK